MMKQLKMSTNIKEKILWNDFVEWRISWAYIKIVPQKLVLVNIIDTYTTQKYSHSNCRSAFTLLRCPFFALRIRYDMLDLDGKARVYMQKLTIRAEQRQFERKLCWLECIWIYFGGKFARSFWARKSFTISPKNYSKMIYDCSKGLKILEGGQSFRWSKSLRGPWREGDLLSRTWKQNLSLNIISTTFFNSKEKLKISTLSTKILVNLQDFYQGSN